ncbi:MAG: hypothetical protein WD960_10275 [Gemmatimonadota bacterium]
MSATNSTRGVLVHSGDPALEERVLRAASALAPGYEAIDPSSLDGTLPPGGGWLLLPPGTPPDTLARALLRAAEPPGGWGVLLLEQVGEEVRVLSLSPGFPEDVGSAAERIGGDGLERGYLDHRHLLQGLGRIRHDINNALTSALAETQFMRMDVGDDSELDGGLAVVEAQLQRIRKLAASLGAVRVGG